MDRERIEQRLAELRAQLAAFVEQANRQVAAFEGGIAALTALLADMAADDPAAASPANDAGYGANDVARLKAGGHATQG